MIETIITICALTMVSPYYDCNHHWDIIIYDGAIPDLKGVLGRAHYKNNLFDSGGTIELSYKYKERIGKWDHLLKGGGVLWHEILHMKCKCGWHNHWDVLEDIRDDTRSHTRIPTIPQSVVPFLKGDWR